MPPPWSHALSGLERIRLLARKQIRSPPIGRLLGIRTTHVVPGAVTMVMPAGEALLAGNGMLEIAPPRELRPVVEPSYDSPDPYLRTFAPLPLAEMFERVDGEEIMRHLGAGTFSMPVGQVFGRNFHGHSEGRSTTSMPASEWFCALRPGVSSLALVAFADMSARAAALPVNRPELQIVSVGGSFRLVGSVAARKT